MKLLTLLFVFFTSAISVYAQGVDLIEYTDLGKFQVGLEGQWVDIDLPYYKPEGITQIPSHYFRALVIHEIQVDDEEIIPVMLPSFGGGSALARGIYIDYTEPEEGWFSLQMPWDYARGEFTNHIIRQGLFFRTDISGRGKTYNIPYGMQKVSLVYSICFLIYNGDHILMDRLESEQIGAQWELEWHLPEGEEFPRLLFIQ